MNTRLFVLLLSIILIGCEKISPFVSDALFGEKTNKDRDHDGIPRPKDCNDEDPDPKVSIHLWYRDLDHDGLGAGEPIEVCDQPADTTSNNSDCDDIHASVFLNAPELCDNLDNDCDGQTDETFSNLGASCGTGACAGGTIQCTPDHLNTVCSTDGNKGTEICDALDNDCNGQTDEAFSTLGASCGTGMCAGGTIQCTPDRLNTVCSTDGNKGTEICDGLDNDCNGQTDEGVKISYYHDSDHDGFGWKLSQHALCAPLADDVTNATDCDDIHANAHPGGTEVCDQIDNDCNGFTDESTAIDAKTLYADVDQDTYGSLTVFKKSCTTESGWVLVSGDCNDLDKLIHPNAKESCNSVDDNCDGQTDEGVFLTFYADKDEDTYGDLSEAVTGCTLTIGHVANNLDCNDGNKNIHPNATEICDNKIDDDCDGITDNAKEASLWYLDADKDGYGTSAVSIYACATPTGYAVNPLDCNDTNPTIHPKAIEICKDGIDNDCNGITDTDTKIVTWYLDFDQDGFGNANKSKDDCLQPPGYVADKTDCVDTNASVHPGANEVCNNGIDDNCDGSVNQCVLTGVIKIANANTIQITGPESQNFAASVATCDLNDDGQPDLVVGSPAWNANQGKVSVYLSPFKGGMIADHEIFGSANGLFGTSLACSTSKNGPMLAIGSPGEINGGNSAGALYLFKTTILKNTSVADADAIWNGTAVNMDVGIACEAIPDQDGDGKEDFFVSADGYNSGTGDFAGAGFVVSSAFTGTTPIQNALASFMDNTKDELAGTAISVGYFNPDAKLDFVLGAFSSDVADTDAGAIYVKLGSFIGSIFTTDSLPLYGMTKFDHLGQSLASGFDLTGDALDDVLIGTPGNGSAQNPGLVQIAHWNTQSANPPFLVTTLESNIAMDRLGYSVSSGIFNADLQGDILIGAPGVDDGGFNSGSVFLQYGPIVTDGDIRKTAQVRIDGESTNSQLGWFVRIGPDLTGDQIPDLILVAKSTKPLRKLYILPGLGF